MKVSYVTENINPVKIILNIKSAEAADKFIGYIGSFSLVIIGTLFTLITTVLLNYTKKLKPLFICCFVVAIIGFVIAATTIKLSLFGLDFFAFTLCGLGLASGNPLGLLLGAEVTYPHTEEKSTCLLHWFSQVTG